MARRHYRQLVALMIGLSVFSIAAEFLGRSLLPEAIRVADDQVQSATVGSMSTLLQFATGSTYLAYVIASLLALGGLFFFKRWAIVVNAVLVLLSPLAWYFMAYNVASWPAGFLAEWSQLGLGALLTVAWFTPLRSEFK